MKNIYNNNLAYCIIKGGTKYPDIYGNVTFIQKDKGVLVNTEIFGLPYVKYTNELYGFHIHEGSSCTGNNNDEFGNTGNHFSKSEFNHPYHSGDMPPLFGNQGYAYMSFFTNRFTVSDIIGKTVIIHADMDDLKTNPSGSSGEKIACGVIKKK